MNSVAADASGSDTPDQTTYGSYSTTTDAAVLKDLNIADLAGRLLRFDASDYRSHPEISAQECLMVCHMAIRHLSSHTSPCEQTEGPVNIVGDLHGQFHDLLRYFDALGQPPKAKYLFLGNYVNRGKFSLEVVILLLCLRMMHPDSVVLLRGNQESASNASRFGFKDEILKRYGSKDGTGVFVGLQRCFQWLPLVAIVGEKLFCCHAGILPSFQLSPFQAGQPHKNLQLLRDALQRPFELPQFGIACDLVWSDPMTSDVRDNFEVSVPLSRRTKMNFISSIRGSSYQFSSGALSAALDSFTTKILVRGHQIAQQGYAVQFNSQCITLFSAPGYHGTHRNHGAVLLIEGGEVDLKKPGTLYALPPLELSNDDLSHLYWLADV